MNDEQKDKIFSVYREVVLGSWRILLTAVIGLATWEFNQLTTAIDKSSNSITELRTDFSAKTASLTGRLDAQAARIDTHDQHFLLNDKNISDLKEKVWTLLPRNYNTGSP